MPNHKTPMFLFHIPMTGKIVDREQLEVRMRSRKPPIKVDVLDCTTHVRLGSMPPSAALAKFR